MSQEFKTSVKQIQITTLSNQVNSENAALNVTSNNCLNHKYQNVLIQLN